MITDEEKKSLIDILNCVKDCDKWVLSTEKVVEDVFKEVITNSVFEYPAHSFILDLSDPLWKKYFTKAKIYELKCFKAKAVKSIPQLLQEYLDSYNWPKTADDIRRHAFTHFLNNEQFGKNGCNKVLFLLLIYSNLKVLYI